MNNQKSTAIDPFRVIASLLIIAIHTAPLSCFSETADFLFSYCFARIAVPFFLMTTGYYTLSPYILSKEKEAKAFPWAGLKKLFLLYLAATLIYLPVNIYAGKLPRTLWEAIKILLFDGTFYHLWYLPAVLLGCMLLLVLSKYLKPGLLAVIVTLLYLIGVLGDSWYGLSSLLPPLKSFYELLFTFSSYTRNGIFYAPLFLFMGAYAVHSPSLLKPFAGKPLKTFCLSGTLSFALLMLLEGYAAFSLNYQRHSSMYLFLPPCMYFLFKLILSLPDKSSRLLRQTTLWVYLLHPLVIILLRGFVKLTKLSQYLIENSLIHYLTVCMVSFLLSLLLCTITEKLWSNTRLRRILLKIKNLRSH